MYSARYAYKLDQMRYWELDFAVAKVQSRNLKVSQLNFLSNNMLVSGNMRRNVQTRVKLLIGS